MIHVAVPFLWKNVAVLQLLYLKYLMLPEILSASKPLLVMEFKRSVNIQNNGTESRVLLVVAY